MLNTIMAWFENSQSEYSQMGLTVTLMPPQEIQTKPSLVMSVESKKVAGTAYLWETGELDMELAVVFSTDNRYPLHLKDGKHGQRLKRS